MSKYPISEFVRESAGRLRVPRDPRQDLEGMAELRSLAKDEKHLQELLAEVLERLQKARNGLNELANQICKAYDNIIRVGRRKLGT